MGEGQLRLARTEYGRGLLNLLNQLQPFRIRSWGKDSSSSGENTDREPAPIDLAHVVSSRYQASEDPGLHAVAIDIDHPAWLVKSTTPGHHHLYIEVPGGIPHYKYMTLLIALAEAGVIEGGYQRASRDRGFSCVRLPWVKKEAESDG